MTVYILNLGHCCCRADCGIQTSSDGVVSHCFNDGHHLIYSVETANQDVYEWMFRLQPADLKTRIKRWMDKVLFNLRQRGCVFSPVRLFVALFVSKITQKQLIGFP